MSISSAHLAQKIVIEVWYDEINFPSASTPKSTLTLMAPLSHLLTLQSNRIGFVDVNTTQHAESAWNQWQNIALHQAQAWILSFLYPSNSFHCTTPLPYHIISPWNQCCCWAAAYWSRSIVRTSSRKAEVKMQRLSSTSIGTCIVNLPHWGLW